MDFGGSFAVLWRRKGLTISLLLLTLLITACISAILPWKYDASVTETLLNSEQSSASLGGGNPYLSFDSSMIDMANFLSLQMNDGANVLALQAKGYTASYQAAVLSENPEAQEPFIQITVSGNNKATVASTLQGAQASLGTLLDKVQANVPAKSRLGLQVISQVSTPVRSTSAKIKPAVGFLGVGLVLTFLIPQLVEGSARRRKTRPAGAAQPSRPTAKQPSARELASVTESDRYHSDTAHSQGPDNGYAPSRDAGYGKSSDTSYGNRGETFLPPWPSDGKAEDDYRSQRAPEGNGQSRTKYSGASREGDRNSDSGRRWL